MRDIRSAATVFAIAFLAACFCLPCAPACAADIPGLAKVPAGLDSDTEARLTQRRNDLDAEYYKFDDAAKAFNAKSAKEQTEAEYESLGNWKARYIFKVKSYNRDVKVLKNRLAKADPPPAEPVEITPEVREKDIVQTQSYLSKYLFPDGVVVNEEKDRDTAKGQALIFSYLFPAEEEHRIFPKNPEEPLINPLREPERYKAWEAATKANLDAQIRKNKAEEVIRQMDKDPALNAARARILKEETVALNAAHARVMKELGEKFDAFRKANGEKDFLQMLQREKEDPAFKQESQAIVDSYWKAAASAESPVRQRSLQQMQAEVGKFFERHPELSQGKNP